MHLGPWWLCPVLVITTSRPLGWPQDGKVLVKSLAKGNNYFKRNINSVYLLGYGKLAAKRTQEGLLVQLPTAFNKIAPCPENQFVKK